jgi:hypothetical protein
LFLPGFRLYLIHPVSEGAINMPAGDVRKKFAGGRVHRGSQVIFGERQHLREVLNSIRAAQLPRTRKRKEIRQLQALIQARADELNRISPGWDRRHRLALDAATDAQVLLKLAATLAPDDFLLARALAEHAHAPAEVLAQLASHPYQAVRENVARHPATPAETLTRLAEHESEPLWFLVACNPATPVELRERLRARMRSAGGAS